MHYLTILHHVHAGSLSHQLFCSMERQAAFTPEVKAFGSGRASHHICSMSVSCRTHTAMNISALITVFCKKSNTGGKRR